MFHKRENYAYDINLININILHNLLLKNYLLKKLTSQ